MSSRLPGSGCHGSAQFDESTNTFAKRRHTSSIVICNIYGFCTQSTHQSSLGVAFEMPFPFTLPTTSAFSFSSCVDCDSHPSLPLNASTHRGVVRDTLKKHKRLPPSSQISNLSTVSAAINDYVPYILAIDAGLSDQDLPSGEILSAVLKTSPSIEWRPTLSGDVVPGRERNRVKVTSFEHEIVFVLSSLGFCHFLTARATLQPLYTTTGEFLSAQQRTTAIAGATKSLLDAASVYDYLARRGEQITVAAPCADVSPATMRALASLAHAEATLLAVLKDDPYPAAVAQDRNKNDTEWMFKAPDIPKVRAHLYARLCLAASEHAAKAASLCHSGGASGTKIDSSFAKYLDDLRRTSRAKACRFFGIDAELGGQTAEGIAWLRAGLKEMGIEIKEQKKGLSFSKFKKDFVEKREDRKVDKEAAWGSDAGRMEETRILEMLDAKWNKMNDTMNTQAIPPINTLLTKMPSGREIHTIALYQPRTLEKDVLDGMRGPPEERDDYGDLSSEDEGQSAATYVGAFPGADEYSRAPSTAGKAYY